MNSPRTKAGRTLIGAGTALAALTLLAGCDMQPTVAQSDVEEQVSASLAEQVGQAPDTVTCPDDLVGEVGTEMRCELAADGETLGLTVTVTSVEDSQVNFDYEVDAVTP